MASDPAAPIVFDRAASFYDATRGFPPGVDTRVAELMAQAGGLDATSRILEVGVGTGRIALPLAAHAGRVVGVDLSTPMLRQLLAKRGERHVAVLRADAATLPFASASFDAVVGVHVFHLIPRWRDVLAEIARVLKPGGLLLHGADEQSEFWKGWRRHLDEDLGYEHAGVPRARFEDFPEDAGFRLVEPIHKIRFPQRLKPKQLLDRVAKRSWSVTWNLSDADLARSVEALRESLVTNFGSLDDDVELEMGFWVRAYRVA